MKMITFALMFVASSAYAQTYTNTDPLTGVTYRNMVYVKKDAPKAPRVVPQSILDGQYVYYPKHVNMRLFDDPPVASHDNHWGNPQITLPPPSYAPSYYGSFVPLTPDGPLINSAFIRALPSGSSRTSSRK